MKKVRILALILALVMALSMLAACGGKTDPEPASTDPAATDPANTEPVTAGQVKVIDVSLTDEEYAFGVAKDQDDLLAKANEYIAQIKADGTLDQIVNKYFGDGEPTVITSAEEDSSKDQLIVATNAAFPPFESTEGENYIGIDDEELVEKIYEIFKEAHKDEFEFTD